ncbi:MAG: pentapeptide repeat-containing protein, partial [Pseudomonadota bacterium]
ATLSEAQMAGADLDRADATAANFSGASLEKARLSSASLVGANLNGADLEGALLRRTDLSGADLTDVRGLTEAQLALACGNADTILPDGMSVRTCGAED